MFRKPNVHIIDIAFDSGFTSLSAFNRAFKKITGMSPSKFRGDDDKGYGVKEKFPVSNAASDF